MEEPDIEHATELDLAMAKSELPTKVAPIIDEGYDSLPKIASVTSEQSYLNEQVPTTHIKLESNNVRKPYLGTEISTDEWKPANIDTASDNSIHERSESTTSSESSAASDYIPTGVLRKWEPVNLATGKKVVVIAKPHHQVIERKAEILILNTAQSLEDEVIPILPDQGIATAPAADSSTSGGKPPKIKNQAKSWIVKSLRKLKIKPSTPKKPSRIVNMIQYALSIHKENGKSKELEENDALLIQISSGRSEEGRKFDSLYQVLHQIGAGGHSILRLAIQKQSGKRVVCKYVTRENIWHWHGSMPLEIHLMKRFGTKENAAFITFIDSVQIGDTFIIVMEYLENEWIDLYDYIEEFGPLNEAETRYIYKQVVDAVKWMHKQGFTHNDIKGGVR